MPKTIEGVGDTTEYTFFTMANIMGVYLRDLYLEEYPEIIPELELIEA